MNLLYLARHWLAWLLTGLAVALIVAMVFAPRIRIVVKAPGPIIDLTLFDAPPPSAPPPPPEPAPPLPPSEEPAFREKPRPPKPTPPRPPKPTPIAPADARETAPDAPPTPAPPRPTISDAQILQDSYIAAVRKYLDSIKRYPTSKEARQLRPEGSVDLWLVLARGGQMLDVGIEQSSGSSILDQAALSTVKRGRFPPFPAEAWPGEANQRFTVRLTFELK